MKFAIVLAHPEPRSFCSALAYAARTELEAAGHQVVLSDLHAMGFNPTASASDFDDRADPDYLKYALEQRHAFETGSIAPDIRIEIDKVLWADALLLCFPLYWFSVPAIMKGWIDRVFISGAFYGGKRIYAKGGLVGKKALVATTMGCRAYMVAEDGIHGSLDSMLRPLLQGTLGYVGMTVLQPFYGFHVPYVDDDGRRKIMEAWLDTLRTFDDRPAIAMPDLCAFGDRFERLA